MRSKIPHSPFLFSPPDNEGGAFSTGRVQLAVTALLLEIAHADEEFSDDERNRIQAIVKERFDLDRENAEDLLELADMARGELNDIYPFIRKLNNELAYDEKLEVIDEVWRVIYTDGRLDSHEDYLVHQFSSLMSVQLRDMIEGKLRAKQEMKSK
ncbi:hypothetical protein GF324_05365 [bacterium]|nr:hypothetical protein [bacterium]